MIVRDFELVAEGVYENSCDVGIVGMRLALQERRCSKLLGSSNDSDDLFVRELQDWDARGSSRPRNVSGEG